MKIYCSLILTVALIASVQAVYNAIGQFVLLAKGRKSKDNIWLVVAPIIWGLYHYVSKAL